MSSELVVPIYVVREDAKVERLGQWVHAAKRLELEREGFPFLGVGTHQIEGDLPWIFWDMAPSGYMGAKFAKKFPELRLPERTQVWGVEEALRAVSLRGEDLSGNLLIGDESKVRFFELAHLIRTNQQMAFDDEQLRSAMDESFDSGGSSLGGDRPKAIVRVKRGPGREVFECLVKFSPDRRTEFGNRWANLLAIEALCAATLSSAGLRTPNVGLSDSVEGKRRVLAVVRFDRTPAGGRRGAATLWWLAASRGEADLPAPAVLSSLRNDGILDAESVNQCELAHSFSSAIGNTDAHLGNYGLTFDGRGKASLAPIYDVLPMVFAPRHDELPDERVTVRPGPMDPRVEPMVADLVRRVRESDLIDQDFKDRWFRYVGA